MYIFKTSLREWATKGHSGSKGKSQEATAVEEGREEGGAEQGVTTEAETSGRILCVF